MSLSRQLRAIMLVLLAAIAVQAIPAEAVPLHRESGSAFNAGTFEVAVSTRDSHIGLVAIAPLSDDRPLAELVNIPGPAACRSQTPWPATYQTGPPARWPLSPTDTPRGPPVLS